MKRSRSGGYPGEPVRRGGVSGGGARRVGTVHSLTADGLITVKASGKEVPSEGAFLTDRLRRPLGTVVAVVGPVRSPYLLVRPARAAEPELPRLMGAEVYG